MPKFTSKYAGLTLQDADGIWAQFDRGEFETDDTKVAARLRKVEDVEEVESEDKPLDQMKVDELKQFAADNSIDLGDATKKDDILAAIQLATEDTQQD